MMKHRAGSTDSAAVRWRSGTRIPSAAWITPTCVSMVLVLALISVRTNQASDPMGATLSPASTPAIWLGTALGRGGLNDAGLGLIGGEDLCEEGVTCDTFTLTIG